MASPRTDIAILGGGIFGLCAAYFCAKAGHSVQVYEKRQIGAGASGGLLGVMSPFSPDRWSPKKALQLAALLEAEAFWSEVDGISGIASGYARVGRATPLYTQAEHARAQLRLHGAEAHWQSKARMWLSDTCAPAAPPPFGFVVDDLSARIHPRQALASLATAARAQGVTITEGQAPDLESLRQSANHVILAAGYETNTLHPALSSLERGVKGAAARLSATLPGTPPVLSGPGFYLVSHGGGEVCIGSTKERDWADATSISPGLEDLIEKARQLVPALATAPVVERWSGIRPRGRYPDPVIGPVPGAAGLWVFTGGYGIGFCIAHSLGSALARWLSGTRPDLPERFCCEAHLT